MTRTIPPAVYSPREIAQLLSITPTAVYNHIAAGTWPVVRIGRSVRVPRSAVDAMLADAQATFEAQQAARRTPRRLRAVGQ